MTERPWTPAPPEPRLAAGALHVWRVDLQAVDETLVELLSPDERERAARIVRERERRAWTRARGVLRALLGRYLERDPRALRFTAGPHGKPALRDASSGLPAGGGPSETPGGSPAPVAQTLAFNLSHSGPLALYALTAGLPVGVDVELDRRELDEPALARRVFGEAQARRLKALDPPVRRREFLRAWVRHEAQVKCLGLGIAAAEGATSGDRGLWIADIDIGGEGAAAVAVEGGRHELRCWTWR
jgi:4'-phosphopantetheinyl transferase